MKITLALSILFSSTSTVTCQGSGAGNEAVAARSESETLSFFWCKSVPFQRGTLSRHCTDRSGDPENEKELWKGPYTRDDGVKCYSGGLGGWDGIKADAGKGCVWAYSYEDCTGRFTEIDLGMTGQSFRNRSCRR